MTIEILAPLFSVLKYPSGPVLPAKGIWFAANTGSEASLVCETSCIPAGCIAREDGWRAMRVMGTLDFSLIGILADITRLLKEAGISVFCVSTYDTDYVLVKEHKLGSAAAALSDSGYEVI